LTSASGDVLVVHSYAVERSEADVEHHRDVIGERRVEDVDGGLLVREEAVDLVWCESLPSVLKSHCSQ
jgi:hypothetical protein